ncbi:protein of unknown function (DUF4326) [Streptoalloteichus tenebrarius]|uniref:DUF4326 domain-containing protein n=1 Tax=Streptoalloteichus tenebrarius (strain ATCC 17920 / DSM 40477 / JCM 4838 / CBS 697.72 / NBRC 16177 / NCIMB 11028 / NRRL B-12390 / A12253. 1 / ISP 5477) TaxID=1933 RepID=A0ABT1HVX8_STRSD|nr:DUF4326 domain-containing protein [Streptoalloteichus tenebrarius]MCP2259680.1 protein of unknown function (DUF4326) [Streptoalloteichus tenebrarius]BFF00657.1 hypothetical protein GCM10020241_23320 [Streptoalloteichus tenebrarius]
MPKPRRPSEPPGPSELPDTFTGDERRLAERVLAGHAVVVNVRRSGPHGRLVPWLVEHDLITYVGHAGPRHSWPDSDFASPFVKEAKTDREAMVRHYREWLAEHRELERRARTELKGRALGCWCAPQPCHADVLAELVERAR